MSHEIRTPMNGIIGLARLMMDTPLSGDQRDYMNYLSDSAESLLGIINEILDLSKIEAGKITLETIVFNLDSFFDRSLQPFILRGREKGVQVSSTGRRVHICAMTANVMKEDMTLCRQAGMDSFIPKPVRGKDIFDLISKLAAGGEQGFGPTPGSKGGEMPPSKIFDREGLLERLGGAEDFVDSLVEKSVDSVAEQLPCLGEALSQDDAASIITAPTRSAGLPPIWEHPESGKLHPGWRRWQRQGRLVIS